VVSGGRGLLQPFLRPQKKRLGDSADIEYLNGLSSLQYLASRLGISYEDIRVVSAHGRPDAVVPLVSITAGFRTDRGAPPGGGYRRRAGRGGARGDAGDGGRAPFGPEERIVSDTAGALAGRDFGDLAVMLVENPAPADPCGRISTTALYRGRTPMTKESVRWLVLALLAARARDAVWDIGAGTGSVSVELARAACEGTVYAVERDDRGAPAAGGEPPPPRRLQHARRRGRGP
jgi:precorrin-6Y C5,15-methyltransferase (decarboxylating)